MTIRTLCTLAASARSKCRSHIHTTTYRWISSTPSLLQSSAKAYSGTLFLPKTVFPLWADPGKNEERFRKRTTEEVYKWQREHKQSEKPVFVLHDGPPYANGNLHMGHALNKILKDIIIRSQLMLGRKVNYIPGWDCHGLPIENKALQELGQESHSVDAETIREAARTTALREIASQKNQFWSLGVMADWDSSENTYRTLDHKYETRQLRIFQKMVEKRLIYRDYRPVHFSPSSRSALAEAELVYKDDHISHSVFVTFTLDTAALGSGNEKLRKLCAARAEDGDEPFKLLVWTTTPWTLTANMAIAVNPELDYIVARCGEQWEGGPYYIIFVKESLREVSHLVGMLEMIMILEGSDLVGAPYIPLFSPLVPQESKKIIPASHVTSDTGTGIVHCAPAHGAEDYQTFHSLGLLTGSGTDFNDASTTTTPNTVLCHVDGEGRFSPEVASVVGSEAAEKIQGKEVLTDGSRAVVELLKQLGQLVKIKRIKHRYPYDWKTDKPVIVTATSQWFANLDVIKDKALKALEEVSFYPAQSRNRLESFVKSRSEWCISRQRVWGVPIPALYHIPTDSAVLDSNTVPHILDVLQEKGVAHWWTGSVEDFIPLDLEVGFEAPMAEIWRKGTDTMDVWFDSGTSWSMLRDLGLKHEGEDFLADVCLEGSDQHRGWFQSQLLTKVGTAEAGQEVKSPYRDLITHGMVLDEEGKKMSKSLGNIISPMTVIHGGEDKKKDPAYGADVLRLWVATVEYWKDMAIGPKILSQAAESMRKVRNSTRFLLSNLGDGAVLRDLKRVPRSQLGLAERYVMHELYTLQQTALEGYATYNFPKVMSALSHFANITLSSLYFDITKDCLYANSPSNFERRSVITVLEQILDTMTAIYAPILPYLAEEVHAIRQPDGSSFFMKAWTPLNAKWEDSVSSNEMKELLRIRSHVLALLEKARGDKCIKSSLEAEVDILVPAGDESNGLIDLLHREENFLKTLFITSDATVQDEGSLGTSSPAWLYTDTMAIPDSEELIAIRVRPATLAKCPRCWTYTRPEKDELCGRCVDVVGAK